MGFYLPIYHSATQHIKKSYFRTFEISSRSKRLLLIFCNLLFFDISFQTVKALSPGLVVFSQSELLMEFHRLLPFGFLEGLTLFSTAYETQMRKKETEDKKMESLSPQDSTWSGSSAKVSGPRLVQFNGTKVLCPKRLRWLEVAWRLSPWLLSIQSSRTFLRKKQVGEKRGNFELSEK